MDKQLRRILNLVRKTGDRMVVTDANGDDVYVVMGLEQYESLVLPQEDLLLGEDFDDGDDLGGDSWGGGLPEVPPTIPPAQGGEPVPSDIWEAMQGAGETGKTWDIQTMNDSEKADLEKQFAEYQRQKHLETGGTEGTVGTKAVEVADEKKDDDLGEEQFYLEPVE